MDYIGTLVNVRYYDMDASRKKLHKALTEAGFETNINEFLEAYTVAHEKYRVVRYKQLKEVTNSVWISEALNNLGFNANNDDSRIKTALNIFFQDYVNSLELRPHAKKLVKKIKENCKLGLISNFTYALVIYASLKKIGVNKFFDTVLVSDEIGWRKPHKQIFVEALRKLKMTAKEAVFIGDTPSEDIKGAEETAIKTVFVTSQFYSLKDMQNSCKKPNFVAEDLYHIYKNFSAIINDY